MAQTVLVLVPHPDDAEYYAGGLLAQFVRQGAKVIIVVATDGRCGSFKHDPVELIHIRREEAGWAAAKLGVEPPILLGYPDFELDRLPRGVLREKFIRYIREFRPDVVVCEDALALNEVHPDHREVAWAAGDAIQYAALPLIHPEHLQQGLEVHFTPEKYFYANEGVGSNRIIDISETIDQKLAALAEHKSQITFLVEGIFRQARQAGIDPLVVLGDGISDPLAAFTWAVQAQAAEVGSRAGFRFGEAYRYERYHPLVETLFTQETTA